VPPTLAWSARDLKPPAPPDHLFFSASCTFSSRALWLRFNSPRRRSARPKLETASCCVLLQPLCKIFGFPIGYNYKLETSWLSRLTAPAAKKSPVSTKTPWDTNWMVTGKGQYVGYHGGSLTTEVRRVLFDVRIRRY
jgi:hypothetical protein